MSDPISAITLGDMRVEYVRTRMVVDEAERRAEDCVACFEAVDVSDWDAVAALVRRLVTDTYEIAYGRGYDAAIDDDCAPPLIVTPQAGVLLCRHPGCPDNGKPLTIGEGQHDH